MSDKKNSAMSQFIGLPSLLRLLKRGNVEKGYRGYVLSRLVFSACLEPFRWYENIRWRGVMNKTELTEPPLFLLGMGRSGTTHLHYLLNQDDSLGVVTNYQAAMHPIALSGRGWLEGVLSSKIPSKRPMDNVALSLDAPQEEELALTTISEHAALHFASFPRELPGIYDRYVTGLGGNVKELSAWKKAYIEILKKATLLSGHKRLLLKTPANTGRVELLTEMFPGAKYVYIVRNPYRVYQSMRNMYRQILPGQTFQAIDWKEIDDWVLHAYKEMIGKYLEQRHCIPRGDLIEIRFEDLDENPLKVAKSIYGHLNIGNFDAIQGNFKRYLDGLKNYEKNEFKFPDDVIETVNEHWGFAFDAFGYEKLSTKESIKESAKESNEAVSL